MKGSKECTGCDTVKPVSEFYKNRAAKDGLQTWCKPCMRGAVRRFRSGEPSQQEIERQERARLFKQGLKKCPKCESIHPLDNFYKNAAQEDGLDNYCKTCRGMAVRKYNRTPKARRMHVAAQLKWREKNQEEYRERMRQYHRNNQRKNRARSAVSQAVANGDLPHISTHDCIECGNEADHYHHHNGYGREHWLDVVPVCTRCHGKEHRTGSKYDEMIEAEKLESVEQLELTLTQ